MTKDMYLQIDAFNQGVLAPKGQKRIAQGITLGYSGSLLLPFQGATGLVDGTQGVALGYELAALSGRIHANAFTYGLAALSGRYRGITERMTTKH